MITLLRRLLCVALTAAVALVPLAGVAHAATDDYRKPVDITFPTIADVRYSDDYANGRSGGRIHRATDIFGPAGAPIYATRSGRVVWLPQTEQGNAGFAIQVSADDGRTYAYYHLGKAGGPLSKAVAEGIKLGSYVKRGQRIGWLGDSGNAAGGTPHLHFEILDRAVIDPYGSQRRNPYASLRKAQGLPFDLSGPAPAPAPVASADGVLKRGDSGPAVTEWQRDLNQTRYGDEITVDGAFGPTTERATKVFQRMAGLGPDGLGMVGPQTRKALESWVAAGKAGTRAAATRGAAATKPAPKPAPRPAAPTTSATSEPLLRLGSRGPAVVQWQRDLNHTRRGNELETDGVYGPRTEHATEIFQKSVGLGPDGLGIVGPKTREALRRVIRAM